MDFLEIRKKAKERAAARAAEEASAPDAAASPAPPDPAPPVADARFTTWRPGEGAPPVPPVDEPAPLSAACPEVSAPGGAPPLLHGSLAELAPAPAEEVPPADPLDEFFYRVDEAAPRLPQLGPAADAAEEEAALVVREEYLTFLLGAEEYAVAIGRVREVIKAPPITEVPRAPAHVLGVVTVRGGVVAVVDPRRRLGLPAAELAEGRGKVVIVDVGEGPCGLLVDRVASVVRLPLGSIEPCPQGVAGSRGEYLAGIGRAGDRLFTVLDPAALLRPPGPARGVGAGAGAPSRRAGRGDEAGPARRDDAGA
jgi:purine-binding chemotaxis protein CheW